MAAALAAPLLALYGLAILALPVVAACGAGLAALRRARRSRPAVTALRMDRDGAFHLRLRDGWHPAEWLAAWRGPRWLTLRARLPAVVDSAAVPAGGCVTLTVWQDSLPAPAWRRTCLLVNRRLCRTTVRRAVKTP
ncbi:hypothetical protein AKI39_07715 [Bordetella sp. H567]|nr:hypothetical protein AKI39_07715 [Bordetella sp. H567]